MAKRKVSQEEQVVVQEVQSQPTISSYFTQAFFEQNQNLIMYVLGGVAALLLGWWLYKMLIVEPKQKDAIAAMWQAEVQFGRDSFQLALENPGGGFDGFVALADKYSGTKAGNMSRYYAGVCYLQTGNFDNAIKYLEDFSADGDILPAMKYGMLGDSYSEKKDFSKALSMYEKATNASKVDLISAYYLKKLGMLYNHEGKTSDAQKAFERLRRDYPNQQSNDWREVEKYMYGADGEYKK
jgi:tetratricopeptide (TPR) repeat protein